MSGAESELRASVPLYIYLRIFMYCTQGRSSLDVCECICMYVSAGIGMAV